MMPDTCIGMRPKELRSEIDRLVAEMRQIQTRISELAAKLMVVTKEEMHREGIHQKTTQRVDAQ